MHSHRLLLSLVTLLATPSLADACGGLFCSGSLPTPVEQSGERILFEVDRNTGTVTTTVDIQYGGDPAAFSWLLPIPVSDAMPVPELALAPETLLRDLELATQPTLIRPPQRCTEPPPPPFAFSQRVTLSALPDSPEDGVDTTDLPNVGPFDNELIQATDVDALVDWLRENGYLVSPEMEPALADYVGEGLAFLGVRLLADADVDEIAPLSVTWPGSEPMIPLRLTSISAEPEMGLLVFIAADQPYGSSNWPTMELDLERLQWNPVRQQTNYHGLLSFQIDEVGGQGFVVERAAAPDDLVVSFRPSAEALTALLERTDVITRLHGRAHPEEMLTDPLFAPEDLSFDGTFDLSDRPAIERCDGAKRNPVPCAETYCGVGGQCAETDARGEGCVCAAGFVARPVRRPVRPGVDETTTVVCQDAAWDFLGELGPAQQDVCAPEACGPDGECVAVNGFPTCSCDEGFAAITDGAGFLVCAEATKIYDRDRIATWSATQCAGCSSSSDRSASLAGLLLLLGTLARRRRP